MGFGIGAAIGAAVGTHERSVLITGDGSFGMSLQELATAVTYNIPVVILILNNSVLGMVRQWQTLFFDKHYSNTTLNRKNDFAAVAKAFGADGEKVLTEEELDELLPLVDHLVFNSLAQWERFGPKVRDWCRDNGREISCGLRINPEHSEGAVAIYNPCSPGSRLGIRPHQLPETLPEGISGLHFHTLCEQGSDALERTLDAVEARFGKQLAQCKWINFGGGHHITREGYDLDRLCRCITRMQQN